MTDGGARLYECIQQSPLPEFGPGTNAGDIANYKPPLAGARLSAVSADTVQRFVDTANEAQVPEAIDLMLRKAGLGPEAMITACLATDGAPLWIVITEQSLTVARCFPNGAQLQESRGKPCCGRHKGRNRSPCRRDRRGGSHHARAGVGVDNPS